MHLYLYPSTWRKNTRSTEAEVAGCWTRPLRSRLSITHTRVTHASRALSSIIRCNSVHFQCLYYLSCRHFLTLLLSLVFNVVTLWLGSEVKVRQKVQQLGTLAAYGVGSVLSSRYGIPDSYSEFWQKMWHFEGHGHMVIKCRIYFDTDMGSLAITR